MMKQSDVSSAWYEATARCVRPGGQCWLANFSFSIVLALLVAGTARGTEYFVATNGLDTGANNGLSWAQPLLTISNGVAKAVNPGDIVTVSNGTYNITTQITVNAAITVRSFGGSVTGGLANASNTIVKVSGGSGNRRVFNITGNATVDGFTARDAVRSSGTMLGGGAYMNNGVVQNCIFTNNSGDTMYGGGAYVAGGVLRNSLILGNGGVDRMYGGGLYITGGVVSNCVISGNRLGGGGSGGDSGGGVYASGGMMMNCTIVDNYVVVASNPGAGVYLNGATLRNCLIARNRGAAATTLGAGVYLNSGVIESCTIVSNTLSSGASLGGGVYRVAGTVTNSVIIFNQNTTLNQTDNYSGLSSANTAYTCTTPALGGNGNTGAYQGLVNLAGGDYRLLPGPAVDAGTNLAWMTGALDLAGNPRTNGVNNLVDMGVYEYVPDALQCGLAADATTVLVPSNVVFTAYVGGTNTSISSYAWDFGDGNTTNGAALAVVTNTYVNPGLYTVTLTVTNTANEGATSSNLNYIAAWATNAYVWTNSPSPSAPYATWATAARLIRTAVVAAPAGVTVWVTNGTYNEVGSIGLSQPMTVRSVQGGLGGASNTILRVGATPLFNISDGGVVVEGLTIRDVSGRGVLMTTGLVQNCIIRNNSSQSTSGDGVNMSGGTVSNCIITANSTGAGGNSTVGAGVYMTGGQLLNCDIVGNTSPDSGGGKGAGVYINGSSARVLNCLIRNNTAQVQGAGIYMNAAGATVQNCAIVYNTATGNGGGAYLNAAGSMVNCTIASNSAVSGGGVYRAAGVVSNSILYANSVSSGIYTNFTAYPPGDVGLYNSCSPGQWGYGNVSGDPLFMDLVQGNVRLQNGSPCIDAGDSGAATWPLDLDGNTRIQGAKVDMGAYENGVLNGNFTFSPSVLQTAPSTYYSFGTAPYAVVFVGTAAGNLSGLTYYWDFNGDGTYDMVTSQGIVTNTYNTAGRYTVTLLVSNALGQTSIQTRGACISVGATHYVVTNNVNATWPYTSWATAASNNIQVAINAAVSNGYDGALVIVSNGTYNITSQISITNVPITVRSFEGGLGGAANTVVKGNGSARIFSNSVANAAIQGLTIQGGGTGNGAGVWMSGGLVSDCIITTNQAPISGSGGGVYMTGGTVSNCLVRGNFAGPSGTTYAGGIYASGGLITHCQIVDNVPPSGGDANMNGGGVYLNGATLRNCLIARNRSRWYDTQSYGGGVYLNSGVIESCTIVSNTATGGGGGVHRASGTAGTIRNSIVYFNTGAGTGSSNNLFTTTGAAGITYCCTTNPQIYGSANVGNITADPLLKDLTEGDYRLSAGSPCLDAGDSSTATWSADLAGKTRIQGVAVDIGAYEYDGALDCTFVGSPRSLIAQPTTYACFGTAPFQVQFTASAAGTNLTGLGYNWDLNNDGVYNDATGAAPLYTFNVAGVYTPRLQVTNAAGEVAYAFKANYVYAGSTHYVVTNNPGAAWPYTSWATAASNSIQAAVNAAASNVFYGSLVIVSNGTYNTTATIAISNGVTVRSFEGGLSGASNTVVKGNNGTFSIFTVSNQYAAVQGFTIRDAGNGGGTTGPANGGGVWMNGGLVSDCIVFTNAAGNGGNGGGVYMTGGTVSNCVVLRNCVATAGNGGGIYASGGLIIGCQIADNIPQRSDNNAQQYGGGVYLNGATLRNCLIARNKGRTSPADSGGGGVYLNNGVIESCTIVSNSCGTGGGGGVYRASGTAGTINNSVVYFNATTGNGTNFYTTVAAGIGYTCTTNPVVAGTGCISIDPLLSDLANSNYTLSASSPCRDAGSNQTWMTGATDLMGSNRLVMATATSLVATVDMGAYEAPTALAMPNIGNLAASLVTASSAQLNGSLVSTGNSSTAVCVLWGTVNGVATPPWQYTNWFAQGQWAAGSSPYTNMAGLAANTLYYYTFGASNAGGTVVATLPTNVIRFATTTTQYWSGVSGLWGIAASWSNQFENPGHVPLPTDDVVINSGTCVVDLASGAVTVNSLQLGNGSLYSLLIVTNGNVTDKKLVVSGDVTIGATGVLTHAAETATGTGTSAAPENHRLRLDVGGNLTVQAGGQINVNAKGYATGAGPGCPASNQSGAGHGGEGGIKLATETKGPTYGSVTNPVNNGSGGTPTGGAGGGTVVLRVAGAVTNNGVITAMGANSGWACGSGGSINIMAGSITGATGVISADGGQGTGSNAGAGGGGRIALVVTNASAIADSVRTNITAYGKVSAPDSAGSINRSAAGTIWLKATSSTCGDLIVNNSNLVVSAKYTVLPDASLRFDSITLTNQGVLALGTNAVLDLTGCRLSCDGTTNDYVGSSSKSRLILGLNSGRVTWTGTWTNNGVISWAGNSATWAVPGGLNIAANAVLTHEAGNGNWLWMVLTNGDLTVETNGAIWVQGRGYAAGGGPYAGVNRYGGVHGGEGGSGVNGVNSKLPTTPTYGSVTNPVTAGGGGFHDAGGGIVIIRASGTVTVNGVMKADGNHSTLQGCGAGGSVNIQAGALLGTGSISANGGNDTGSDGGGGGGGRIAMALTSSASFGNVAFSAVGGTNASANASAGAAGTVYLKGNNQAYGTLIVSNHLSAALTLDAGGRTNITTTISPAVLDAVVGDVQILNLAKFSIATNQTLTVYGSWSNAASVGVTNLYGQGTVVLAGASPATVWGSNTWYNLTITNAGKVVSFQHSVTQVVYGVPAFSNNVTLQSTQPGNWWYLRKPGSGTQDVGRVFVQDSNATNGWTFRSAAPGNNGHNVNWRFFAPRGMSISVY